MAFKLFDKSLFSQVFSKNSYESEFWAENVYNKIKNSKLLPAYITRSKKNESSNLIFNGTSEFISDNDFSFGSYLKVENGGEFLLEKEINWGKNFDLSFELLTSELVGDFSIDLLNGGVVLSRVTLTNSLIVFGNTTDLGSISDYMIIRVVRNHNNILVYINNSLADSFTMLSDEELSYYGDLLFVSCQTGSYMGISNIRVLSFDNNTILNWWKLNCQKEGSFIDVGSNDYDFYAFFFSICKFISYIVIFSRYFKFTDFSEDFIKRFLDSRNIYYSRYSDIFVLSNIFNNWKRELSDRGTLNIVKRKDTVKNISFYGDKTPVSDYSLKAEYESQLSFSTSFEIGFDILIKNGLTDYDLLGGVIVINNTAGLVTITFNLVDGAKTLNLVYSEELEDGKYNIKFIRTVSNFNLYIDNVLVSSDFESTVLTPTLKFSYLFDLFKKEHLIHNLYIKYKDIITRENLEVRYLFNDFDTLFLNSVCRIIDYEARLMGLNDVGDYLMSRFFVHEEFTNINNYNYKEEDGELIRLFSETDSTKSLVLAKADLYDMSWVLENCSPCEQQTYPIISFNQLPNKFSEVKVLADYPVRNPGSDIDISFSNIFVEDNTIKILSLDSVYRDIIKNQFGVDLHYLNKWTINCISSNSYEVSFRMKVTGTPNFNLSMYMVGTGLKSAKTGVETNYFFNDYNFNLSGEYWLRGIIYSDSIDLDDREVSMSFDMQNSNHLKFTGLVPNPYLSLAIGGKSNLGDNCDIYLHDFQFRLLELPFTKVSIGQKNILFVHGRNNSNYSVEELEKMSRNLIPYNSLIKIL